MPLKSKPETIPTSLPFSANAGTGRLPSRQMPAPAVFHPPQRFNRRLARRHGVGLARHDVGQYRAACAFSFRQHTVNGITPGENAEEAAIALGHQDGADAKVAHGSTGLSYRGARRKGDRVLVLHPCRTSSSCHDLSRGPERWYPSSCLCATRASPFESVTSPLFGARSIFSLSIKAAQIFL